MKNLYIKILIFVCIINYTVHSIPPPKILTEQSIKKYNELKEIMKPKSEVSKSARSSSINHAPSLNKTPVPRFNWNGTVKLIVIPMQFTDVTFTEATPEQTKSKIRDGLFGAGENSLASFYNRSSYGKMNVEELIITNIVTSAHEMSYYGLPWDDSAGGTLPVEALDLAYSNDADFRIIADNPQNYGNGDEYIMGVEAIDKGKTVNDIDRIFLMIIHAGGAQENTGTGSDIWSHQWTINGNLEGYKVGEATFYSYSTFAEFNTDEGSPISIACHEFAHQLGASDLYDISGIDDMGTGYWSLMDNGVWNGYYAGQPITNWWGSDFEAYHKTLFGWISPVIMNYMPVGDNSINLKSISNVSDYNENLVYRYNLNTDGSIYYLLSVRSKEFYDRFIPFTSISSGMMILKIDENQKIAGESIFLENGNKQAITFIRANNEDNDHTSQTGKDENDFYPYEGKDFSPVSIPSSAVINQETSPLTVKDITRNLDNSIDFIYESIQVRNYNDVNENTVELVKATILENPYSETNFYVLLFMNFNPADTFEVNVEFMDSQEITTYYTSTLNRLGKSSYFSGNFNFSGFPENTEIKLVIKVYNSSNNLVVNKTANQIANNSPVKLKKVSDIFLAGENKQLTLKSTNLISKENVIEHKDLQNIETFKVFGNCFIEDVNNNYFDSGAFYYNENKNWKLLDKKITLRNPVLGIFVDKENPVIYNEKNNIIVSDQYSGLSKIDFYDNDLMIVGNYELNGYNKIIYNYPNNAVKAMIFDKTGNKSSLIINKAPLNNYEVEIYPNPASDFVNIKFDTNVNEDSEFKVYDNSGRIVYKQKLYSPFRNIFWDLRDKKGYKIANGVFYIKIKSNSGYEKDLKLGVIK